MRGNGRSWLNHSSGIFAWRQARVLKHHLADMEEDEEFDQILRMITYWGWRFWLNWLTGILLKLNNAEMNTEGQKLRPDWKTAWLEYGQRENVYQCESCFTGIKSSFYFHSPCPPKGTKILDAPNPFLYFRDSQGVCVLPLAIISFAHLCPLI